MLTSTSESRRAVQELVVYLYYVILQMFESDAAGHMKQVKAGQVKRHASRNEKLLLGLQSAHRRWIERVGRVEASRQPHVMRYLCEALFEDTDPDIELTEDESGLVLLVLKTVVDALDETNGAWENEPA